MSGHGIHGNAGQSGVGLEHTNFKAYKYRAKCNTCVVFIYDGRSRAVTQEVTPESESTLSTEGNTQSVGGA
jgi:hypothetical protein